MPVNKVTGKRAVNGSNFAYEDVVFSIEEAVVKPRGRPLVKANG